MAIAPKTVDEYLDLVDQAIYELDELMRCAEDEGDPEDSEFSALPPAFEQLRRGLRQLHAEVVAGAHVFGAGPDLGFLPLARRLGGRLPFRDLLEALNRVHRSGFASRV